MNRPQAVSSRFVRACARVFALALLLCVSGARAGEDDARPANVYMTGADVRIDRTVDGDLVAAAGRIHVDQPVAGDAVLGAGSIDVQSPIGEDLRGAGGIITVAGRVGHEVLLAAGRIIFTPAADVAGETRLAAASVSLAGRFASGVRVYARDITVSTALFFGVPPIAVLLIITIIGIPIALALIVLHAIALVCGYVVTAVLIGKGIGRTTGRHAAGGWQQYAFLTLAVVVLALVTSIPYLGVVMLLVACSAGLGAIVLQRFSRRSAAWAATTGVPRD